MSSTSARTANPAVSLTATAAAPARSALVLGFTAIYLIWGSTYLGIRVAVETMPPFLMAAVRFFIAGTALLTFLKIRGAGWPTRLQWRSNAIIGTFLLLGGNGLVAWAEQVLPSGITALLIGVSPLFIVLTEWAWPGGTRPTGATLAALALGFFGVAWLAAPWESAASGRLDVPGVIAVLAGCVSWGIGSIYTRHAKHGADPLMASALQMIGGAAALFVVALLHRDLAQVSFATIAPRSWLALGYLICVGSLVGFSTFVWLMKHAPPARVATYAYVNPVVAVFLGWLILGEQLTSRTLVASAIIVAAVAIITTQKAKAKH